MHRITDRLFLSDWGQANDEHFLRGNNITAVLNVCNQRDTSDFDGVQYAHYPMNDDHTATEEQLFYAVKTLDLLLKDNERVLVHCLAGVSRSPMIVALYVAWKCNVDFQTALTRVKKERNIVNPNKHFLSLGQKVLERLLENHDRP